MKKQLLIVGIIVLLICVGLSGCQQKSNNGNSNVPQSNGNSNVENTNPLEGTWIGSIDASITVALSGKITELTFTSNSVYVTYTIPYLQPSTFSGTYQTQGDKLLITNPTPGYNSFSFTYSISGNDLYLNGSDFTKQ